MCLKENLMKKIWDVKRTLAVAGVLQVVLLGATVTVRPLQAQQVAATQTGQVTVPPQGPRVDREVALKQLKDNMPTQIAEFLKVHNDARAEVGVPPLVWDATLAAYAQEWADQLAKTGKFDHRTNNKYGENLASYMPETGMRPVHGAKLWYDEIKNYDAVNNTKIDPKGVEIGHYTQMVWRKTTKVGFGIAMGADGMAVLCANYEVPGNMNNEHPYK